MENRVPAIIALAAVLIVTLILGLIGGWYLFAPTPIQHTPIDLDNLPRQVESMHPSTPSDRGPALRFDSWDTLRAELDALIGLDRIALLARYSETVPQVQIASPTTEGAIDLLNEQSHRLAEDSDAKVRLDTIYTYPVKAPESGRLTVHLIDGLVNYVEFVSEASDRRLDATAESP